ncbi:hypothetical protein [Martelella alba]|uniref:Uncharacterized protein n=1 Tax=Martelella alba TaxID=2590451 RepID=A0ABY2SKG5_9HYPH|nr:hypothetical protein [Martelella alba]TKI06074.1 hypothetical protein FCN80_11155 [Martelella alba]
MTLSETYGGTGIDGAFFAVASSPAPLARPISPGRGRTRRNAPVLPPAAHADWRYHVAWYLRQHAAAQLDLARFDDLTLAETILDGLERFPALTAEIARLTLGGSRFYGERKGERLAEVQQKSLIGRALCQLLYGEDGIEMYLARLFAANRAVTQGEFIKRVGACGENCLGEKARRAWRLRYLAFEIPVFVLHDAFRTQPGGRRKDDKHDDAEKTDNLWVGSLTWTLMQFGARLIALQDPEKLESATAGQMMALGLELTDLFRQGQLVSGVEATMYLGLLLFYLRARPKFTLDKLNGEGVLRQAFGDFIEELATYQSVVRQVQESLADYKKGYEQLVWRSRENAARMLLRKYCGSIGALSLVNTSYLQMRPFISRPDPVRQLMQKPSGQRCRSTGKRIPHLDVYFSRAVEAYAKKIRKLDIALLKASFRPSDISDDHLQHNDYAFLLKAQTQWVKLRLIRKRQVREMFFSNRAVVYYNKPDTLFFRAQWSGETRFFVLKITREGYTIKKVNLSTPDLDELRPYMENWPDIDIASYHQLSIVAWQKEGAGKSTAQPLVKLLAEYAELHYRYYSRKIYEKGLENDTSYFSKISHAIVDYIIPFYSCINSLINENHKAAFTECLTDAVLVAIPFSFAGIKAGKTLFRGGAMTLAQATIGPAFRASERQIFKTTLPTSTQIAGGIRGTRAQAIQYLNVIGKEFLMILDPGVVPLSALSVISKGLFRAITDKSILPLAPLASSFKKIALELPKIALGTDLLDFPIIYGYGRDGLDPINVDIKGVSYSVLRLKNSSLVVVETGEMAHSGHPLYVQLDIQNQRGFPKKYLCVNRGGDFCRLEIYRQPELDNTLNNTETLFIKKSGEWRFSFSLNTPVRLAVAYPFSSLTHVDTSWVVFEIDGRRWGFERHSGALAQVGDSDNWREEHRSRRETIAMLEPGTNNRSFNLRLIPFQADDNRAAAFYHHRQWLSLVADYVLPDQASSAGPVSIHDDTTLNVKIGERRFRLSPQPHAATFLLIHPRESERPAYRLSYTVGNNGFVLAAPSAALHVHRIGELLRQKIEMQTPTNASRFSEYLLPPLLCGAFRDGNRLFLRIGDRTVGIAPLHNAFYACTREDGTPMDWTLRYELFTGSFELVGETDDIPLSLAEVGASWFEAFAGRLFNQEDYPTLHALCHHVGGEYGKSALNARLRQVALLLRLDEKRRKALLHASSAVLRTFLMERARGSLWPVEFPALALWARAEDIINTCLSRQAGDKSWLSRILSRVKEGAWRIPPPVMMTQGHEQHIFLLNKVEDATHGPNNTDFAVNILADGLYASPISEGPGIRRWLPANRHIQHTIVSKVHLSGFRQPTLWTNEYGDIWVQAPDGTRTRLLCQSCPAAIKVDTIVMSPDGAIVVLIRSLSSSLQRAEFYRLPGESRSETPQSLEAYETLLVTDFIGSPELWWVTDEGKLFIPQDTHWRRHDQCQKRWVAPEGYRPNFVSADQRYIGYNIRDPDQGNNEILLFDIGNAHWQRLVRDMPPKRPGYGLGAVVSVAFSALNMIAALGFSDGYVELYRIDDTPNGTMAASLGHHFLPLARLVLPDAHYPKPKQMALKFDNAFDRLLALHDIGDFSAVGPSNGTYILSEIVLRAGDAP